MKREAEEESRIPISWKPDREIDQLRESQTFSIEESRTMTQWKPTQYDPSWRRRSRIQMKPLMTWFSRMTDVVEPGWKPQKLTGQLIDTGQRSWWLMPGGYSGGEAGEEKLKEGQLRTGKPDPLWRMTEATEDLVIEENQWRWWVLVLLPIEEREKSSAILWRKARLMKTEKYNPMQCEENV